MSGDAIACLFASAPIRDCGRLPVAEAVLASSWPLGIAFLVILAMAGWSLAKTLYPRPIKWPRADGLDWDTGPTERSTIETQYRRAGE